MSSLRSRKIKMPVKALKIELKSKEKYLFLRTMRCFKIPKHSNSFLSDL